MVTANESWLLGKEALARGEIDVCLDRFDEAWQAGVPPQITDVLAGTASDEIRSLLLELIKIDLEHRWRRCPAGQVAHASVTTSPPNSAAVAGMCVSQAGLPWQARLEDYEALVGDYLALDNWPMDMVIEEYRVRQLWGDRPSAGDYIQRFSQLNPNELQRELQSLDRQLSRRASFSRSRRGDCAEAGASGFSAALDSLCVGDEIDDFRLLNELGTGSFARVFLAQQKSMQRLVALKVSERKSFESPLLSQLDHPNIVRVFDERRLGPLTLMYMQYISGGTLRAIVDWRVRCKSAQLSGHDYLSELASILREKGESPTQSQGEHEVAASSWGSTVSWLGARLADALDHAHGVGVRHRDIKPENILVASDGRPMLVDFNLSFGNTVVGTTIDDAFGGSLAYMAPEQLQVLLGETTTDGVGAASDVYSLAIVLWELLSGEHPFAASDNATCTGLVTGAPQSISGLLQLRLLGPRADRLPSNSPRGLRKVLLQSLSVDPAMRPLARDVARQLQLSNDRPLDELLHPAEESWAASWSRHPLRWLVILGLAPNACVSALNIWANGRLTTHNFDRAFFDNVEKPVVNLVAYTVGILAAVIIMLPIARGLSRRQRLDEATRARAARRCITMPAMAGLMILGLWVASGIVFPLWNRLSEHSQVGSTDVAGFVLSQILHGIIAGTTSFAVTSFVMLQAFLPRLMTAQADLRGQRDLDRLSRWLSLANGALSLTPLLAVLALTFSDQFDKAVFVVLALVGFISHVFISLLTPKIRERIAALQRALAPTQELLK